MVACPRDSSNKSFTTDQNSQKLLVPSPRGGGFGGLRLSIEAPPSLIEIWNTINQCNFYQILERQNTLHKREASLLKTSCRRFWLSPYHAYVWNKQLLNRNNCLLGCKRVMETRPKFHFSWVYTFFVMFSSFRNWANHDRYQLQSTILAELCWLSSGPQPFNNVTWLTTQ